MEAIKQLIQQLALVHAVVRADVVTDDRHNGGKVKSVHSGLANWNDESIIEVGTLADKRWWLKTAFCGMNDTEDC